MRIVGRCVLALFALWLGGRIANAEPQYITDPDKYAADVVHLLADKDLPAASKMIADTIGKASYADNLQNALNVLSSNNIDYSEKVVDHSFGKGLRQIVYYCFVDNVGFIYFRFNYKMSSHGWILANFIFKTETNELFPKDFVEPQN
jgi:hypothetical protein